MKNKHYLLLIPLAFLTACLQKLNRAVINQEEIEVLPAPVRLIRQIELQALRSIDISENMSILSTHDDEIILIAYLLQPDADSLKILDSRLFRDLTFDSSRTEYALDYKMVPETGEPGNTLAAFLLVELDNSGTEENIKYIFDRKIVRFTDGHPPSRLAVDTLFGTDDFLDLEVLPFDEVKGGGEQEVIFKGMHLFDRFEYRLLYREKLK